LPYRLQGAIGLLLFLILCGVVYGVISLVKLNIMNSPNYILIAITIIIGFTSLVIASRKSGYIFGYGISFRDKYTIDKDGLGDYGRTIFWIIAGLIIIGLLLSQDMLAIFEFTVINAVFIGHALAWRKVIWLR
jgi:hypothetical protein